jgi:hypothetical protein
LLVPTPLLTNFAGRSCHRAHHLRWNPQPRCLGLALDLEAALSVFVVLIRSLSEPVRRRERLAPRPCSPHSVPTLAQTFDVLVEIMFG